MNELKECGCGKVPKEIYAIACGGIADVDFIIVPVCCHDWLIGFESNFDGDPHHAWEDRESTLRTEMIKAWNAADRRQSQ